MAAVNFSSLYPSVSSWFSTINTAQIANFSPSNSYPYPVDTSAAAITVTLPTSGLNQVWFFDKGAASTTTGFATNNLTINPGTGQTIAGGNSSLVMNVAYTSVILQLIGTDWKIIGGIP